MDFMMRVYRPEVDKAICEFLEKMHADHENNSSRVLWELLKNVPCFEMFQPEKFGIWYEHGEVSAFVRPSSPWPVSIVVDHRSTSEDLLLDIIHYTEETFTGTEDNNRYLVVSANENKGALKDILLDKGYKKLPGDGGMLQFLLHKEIPDLSLPDGFYIK